MKDKKNKEIWTIKDVLLWTSNYFKKNEILSPQLNAEMIMAKVLNCSRMELYLNYNKLLNPKEREEIRNLVKKRATHYPLQYLLGETEFYGYKFFVDEGVMIPRPETEILVDAVTSYIKKSKNNHWQILDIGTGTGIIPISLSKHFSDTENDIQFLAVDISESALQNAKKNIEFHKIKNIKLLQSDLFKEVSGIFDIIISNPPYIAEAETENLQKEVKEYEPKSAILGGENGLQYYKMILEEAPDYLKKDGKIFFEIGAYEKNHLEKIITELAFKIIDIVKDYNNLYRVLILEKVKENG
jgi:release factor glutamine methyltransferase